MGCYLFVIVVLLLSFCLCLQCQSHPLLLVVSFDGFRHDYPKLHGPLKNFQRLAQRGVHAVKLTPTFITATFPNHYTLVTGLYEDVHGLISNYMYDPKTNVTFDSSGNFSNGDWWPKPAIWSFNEQRKGARSGVAGWPQDPISISKFQSFHRSRLFREVIDQILQWFNDPIEPINFGAIYHHEPDLTGHQTGPYSANMTDMVRQCDAYLGYLLDRIEMDDKLRDHLHLILVSDHGMAQINGTATPIYLDDYVDMNLIEAFGIPPVMNIFVRLGPIETILNSLRRMPHAQVYRREDIPERFHYKNHERIGDILLFVETGYEIHRRSTPGKKKYDLTLIHGNHGYDNLDDSMQAIFYAMGPKFKRNFTLDASLPFVNLDLFGLMCVILEIDPCPPSNGTLAHVQPFLLQPNKTIDIAIYALALFGLTVALLTAILWSVQSYRYQRVRSGARKTTL